MEKLEEAREKIFKEITEDDTLTRTEFLQHFSPQVNKFSDFMAKAFLNWRSLDIGVEKNHKLAYISALVFTFIHLNILSMKMFVSGHTIAAGNLLRQVLEAIAVASLCSGKKLTVLERFINNQYSPQKAIRDLKRHSTKLGLNEKSIDDLQKAETFYHKYSHISLLAIASGTSFSKSGLYVGGAFDKAKVDQYKKEMTVRLSLAEVFSIYIDGVKVNLAKW